MRDAISLEKVQMLRESGQGSRNTWDGEYSAQPSEYPPSFSELPNECDYGHHTMILIHRSVLRGRRMIGHSIGEREVLERERERNTSGTHGTESKSTKLTHPPLDCSWNKNSTLDERRKHSTDPSARILQAIQPGTRRRYEDQVDHNIPV